MIPVEISETPLCDPSIRLLDHLPDDLVDDAATLYLSALADTLIPVYGAGLRARRALACGFNQHMCITAVENDRLVGVLGIQTAAAGFMDVTVNTLQPFYGTLGSLWRMALLAFLNHSPMAEEAYIDGDGQSLDLILATRQPGPALSSIRSTGKTSCQVDWPKALPAR